MERESCYNLNGRKDRPRPGRYVPERRAARAGNRGLRPACTGEGASYRNTRRSYTSGECYNVSAETVVELSTIIGRIASWWPTSSVRPIIVA